MATPFAAAQNLFGLPQSYQQLSDFFPDSGEDSAYINQIEERPNTSPQRVSGVDPRMLIAAAQAGLDPMEIINQAKSINAELQGTRIIKGLSDINFNDKDSNEQIARLFSKNPKGVQIPGVQHVLNMKALAHQQDKNTSFDEPAQGFLKKAYQIDINDPEFPEKFQALIAESPQEVLAHPRVSSELSNLRNHASSIGQKREALAQQKLLKRTEDERELSALRRSARSAGLDPSKYDNIDDLSDAYADKRSEIMKTEEARKSFSALPHEIKTEYAKAMTGLQDTHFDDETKMENVGISDKKLMTQELWDKGYAIERRKRLDKARAAAALVNMEMGGLPGGGTPSQSTEPGATVPVVTPSPDVPPPMEAPIRVTPSTVPPLAPADLRRDEFYNEPPVVHGFERIRMANEEKAKNLALEEAAKSAEIARQQQAAVPIWERAKSSIAEMMSKDTELRDTILRLNPTDSLSYDAVAKLLGINPADDAFKDPSGRNVKMREVIAAVMQDARFSGGTQEPITAAKITRVTPKS